MKISSFFYVQLHRPSGPQTVSWTDRIQNQKKTMNHNSEEHTVHIESSKALRELASKFPQPTQKCNCPLKRCVGWSSLSESDWPKSSMKPVATLQDPLQAEPTFEEFHPSGTRYDSEDAPFAVEFFPLNRSQLFACKQCDRLVLKYTEFGGYYVDPRARILEPSLIAQIDDTHTP